MHPHSAPDSNGDRHEPVGADASPASSLRAAVATLESELGPEAVAEVLGAFLIDTPERLDELDRLAAGVDQPALRLAAHSLKGSSALFGALGLEDAARALEESAASLRRDEQPALAARVRSEFVGIQPELEALWRAAGSASP
ncbi:MAG: Hpt domain-containing protein [Verrucomicrobiae bacterium]|nr:Hpt domain-containing protein [Verrucomicrobiae bacterium]